jgi:hypothetical protein
MAAVGAMAGAQSALPAQDLRPRGDGTLVDGSVFGVFDGTADAADWTFNESSYEGAITLTTDPGPGVEHRVVCEYDLSAFAAAPSIDAHLTFKLRGVARFPADAAEVQIIAYPADLNETLSDFSAGPTILVATRFIQPFQSATSYMVDAGGAVNQLLQGGTTAIGIRFQINPDTASGASQAFMDVLDAEPGTKPVLSVTVVVPGDSDGDLDVDLDDYRVFTSCLRGPDIPATTACRRFDFDADSDVDLRDAGRFDRYHSLYGR